MLSLVRYLEVEKMEGKRNSFNLVPDEDLGLRSSSSAAGIPTKDGGESSYYADVNNGVASSQEHGSGHGNIGKSFKEFQIQNVDSESVGALAGYGSLLGPGDYRRLGQWSESLSEHSERYKRGIGDVADVSLVQEERRVRSRPEASAMLTNLLGRRDETDLHMSISARTLRPSGGKDRHSKVFTAKGPRDRRVRLSVSTAIQFYDVQDRLGYDQPSKAVEWLMKKAKNAIDELSQIPLPGIDRLVPSSSNSVYHPYGYESEFLTTQSSSSDVQLKGLGAHVQASVSSELPSSEAKGSREQAVDDSDTFLSTRQSAGSTRRGELATDITMSVGERKNQVHSPHLHHHTGLSSFSPSPLSNASSFLLPSAASSSGGRQSWKSLSSQHHHHHHHHGYLYDDPCSSLSPAAAAHEQHQRLQEVGPGTVFHHASPLQYHHQLNVHQSYLQQQDFLGGAAVQQPGHGLLHNNQSHQSSAATVLPFGMMPSGPVPSQSVAGPAKAPYLDHFQALKMAPRSEKPVIATASPSVASSSTPAGRGFTAGLMGSSPTAVQAQQHLVGGFPTAESSQMIQSLDEQLRNDGKKT